VNETGFNPSQVILLVGVIIVANFLAKSLLERWSMTALIGSMGLISSPVAMGRLKRNGLGGEKQ